MTKTAEETVEKKPARQKEPTSAGNSDDAGAVAREPRPEKVALVEEIKKYFQDSKGIVFTEYRGLDVSEMVELRAALGTVGTTYKIYKNTLVRLATTDIEPKDIQDLLIGPVGIAFVDPDSDYSDTARALADYKKAHDVFLIKGGFSEGQLMDAGEFAAFAKLPPLAVLQAQLAGALQAPASQFAGLLSAVLQKFAGQLLALQQERQTQEPADEPAAAPTAKTDDTASDGEATPTEPEETSETETSETAASETEASAPAESEAAPETAASETEASAPAESEAAPETAASETEASTPAEPEEAPETEAPETAASETQPENASGDEAENTEASSPETTAEVQDESDATEQTSEKPTKEKENNNDES